MGSSNACSKPHISRQTSVWLRRRFRRQQLGSDERSAGLDAVVHAKVLRFNDEIIWDAIHRACIAALLLPRTPKLTCTMIFWCLKALHEDVGVIDADEASTKQKRNMGQVHGFFQKEEPGRKYVVRSADLMKAFPSSPRARRVVEWLDDEGFLRHQRDRKAGISTEWAQTHTEWPSGQRVRSFVLFFPGGLSVLDRK